MSNAAAREAERLAISAASARVIQALDALDKVPREVLTADEWMDLEIVAARAQRLYRSLQSRLSHG